VTARSASVAATTAACQIFTGRLRILMSVTSPFLDGLRQCAGPEGRFLLNLPGSRDHPWVVELDGDQRDVYLNQDGTSFSSPIVGRRRFAAAPGGARRPDRGLQDGAAARDPPRSRPARQGRLRAARRRLLARLARARGATPPSRLGHAQDPRRPRLRRPDRHLPAQAADSHRDIPTDRQVRVYGDARRHATFAASPTPRGSTPARTRSRWRGIARCSALAGWSRSRGGRSSRSARRESSGPPVGAV
jgi:hypothetical protein